MLAESPFCCGLAQRQYSINSGNRPCKRHSYPTMKTTIRIVIASALIALASCRSTKSTGQAMANAKCPISNEALGTKGCTTEFNGQTIGFCCEKCMAKFNAMPADEKTAKVTSAMPTK